MSYLLWLRDLFSGHRLGEATAQELGRISRAPAAESRRGITSVLQALRERPGPKVYVGETEWGDPVQIPLMEFVKACGLTTGGMGAGKSMFATLIIEALVNRLPELRTMAFGVLDAKGELFDRALYLLGQRLASLEGRAQEALLRRIVVIDFSSRQAVSPYNILARWPYTEPEFFITNRLETLKELLPAGEKLSLRGASVLKHALFLLAESGLPLTYLSELLSSDTSRANLVARSRDPAVRFYFQRHYSQEGKQTIAALRTRMETLFASEGVRLALDGSTAPDFRQLQNEGKIVLVNCAGPTITRGVRLLLQGLVLSDIRQAIFARPNQPPVNYLWFADEAQNFFLTRQQQDDMADILTMSRSFGTFFYFLCQNLSTAVPDTRVLEQLHTNIRWSLTLRGTPRDAQFLRSALPVTGRRVRPEPHPFRERSTYSLEEERGLLLDGIAHLPDRVGYLWLKTRSPHAIRVRTAAPRLPRNGTFQAAVRMLRDEARIGARVRRDEYETTVAARDDRWFESSGEGDLQDRLARRYAEEEKACRS
jgi:hypothetical protein